MIRVTQHIPGFVSGVVAKQAEVHSIKELLNLAWVAKFLDLPPKTFYRWSVADDGHLLMAEYDNGDYYLVVAYLSNIDSDELPIWQPPTKKE